MSESSVCLAQNGRTSQISTSKRADRKCIIIFPARKKDYLPKKGSEKSESPNPGFVTDEQIIFFDWNINPGISHRNKIARKKNFEETSKILDSSSRLWILWVKQNFAFVPPWVAAIGQEGKIYLSCTKLWAKKKLNDERCTGGRKKIRLLRSEGSH